MRAAVRAVISSDFDDRTWTPDQDDNFSFWIQVFVGPLDGEGDEQFQAQVCTPKWLMEHHATDDVIIGWSRIIVFRYDWETLERRITEFVSAQRADDWQGLAARVSRLGPWEFDE